MFWVLKTVNFSLMPNGWAGGWQGIIGRPGKMTKMEGLEWAGGGGRFP